MESTIELTVKLGNFQSQLSEVEDCLTVDPTNEQFLKIRDDLKKVISTLQDVLESNPNEQVESGAIAGGDESENESEGDDENEANESAFARAARPIKTGSIQVGEIVEVVGGDRPYAGVATQILESGEYRVRYFEYGDAEVTLPVDNLKRITHGHFSKEEAVAGLRCKCKYSQDQKLYDVVVVAVIEHGVTVKYSQYGNTEDVPVEYLVPITPKAKKQSSGLIKIPENLKILPTDTEEEKLRKKKRIKAIKSKNRFVTKEVEVAAVKKNWQSFVTKAAKKNISGLTKSSMFASPVEVDGKVGVTNSGKGTTEFAQRKKHKF